MIALEGLRAKDVGGPYDVALGEGQVLGVLAGEGDDARAFLEAVLGTVRHGGRVTVRGRPRQRGDAAYAPYEPEQILFGQTGRDALRGPGALDALRLLGGEELLDRDFLRLSSGERRRLALAAVLGSGRPLLLFDRPTAGLDPEGQERFWRALRTVRPCAIVAALDESEALRCDLLLAVPGRGGASPGASPLPRSLTDAAHWPPSPLSQVAFALLGAQGDLARLRKEVLARCEPMPPE